MISHAETLITLFTRINAAALNFFTPQVRRLFEGGAYLMVDATKNCINYDVIIVRINR